MGKKRIIKKYEQLEAELRKLINESYPDGFEENLISFQTPKGELELALPLETEEISYLIKMPKNNLPEKDDDDDSSADDEIGGFESLDAAEDIADDD